MKDTRIVRAFAAHCLLLAACVAARAAQPAEEQSPRRPKLLEPSNRNNSYLADLRVWRGEFDRFRDDRNWRGYLLQMIATHDSYVGRCQKAFDSFDAFSQSGGGEAPPAMSFADYEPCDAIDTILGLADRHQVIMINEAHHVPLHRAFTLQLLERLYQKGFRYFAAETLTANDSELQTRGYPTMKSGYYTHEPVYADLVRTALRLGYKVVPYEHEPGMSQPNVEEDPFADQGMIEAQNAREAGQAQNLYERILRKDPHAKILVHAGYAHISKQPATWEMNGKKGEIRFMAVAFRGITGIEPLSIDQTTMTERSSPAQDGTEYRSAIEQGLASEKAVVLRHKTTNEWFTLTEDGAHVYDLVVVHPRSRYENGRPTWLSMGGRRRPHTVKTEARPPQDSSYLAQAFYAQETGDEAVPVDQMEYTADEPAPTLWLPSGEFRIRVIDDRGATLGEYTNP